MNKDLLIHGDRGGRTITLDNGHVLTTKDGVRCRHSHCWFDMVENALYDKDASGNLVKVRAEFIAVANDGTEYSISDLVSGVHKGYTIKLSDGREFDTAVGIKGTLQVLATPKDKPFVLFLGSGPWFTKQCNDDRIKATPKSLPETSVATAPVESMYSEHEVTTMDKLLEISSTLSVAGIGHRIVSADKKWIQKVAKTMEKRGTKGALHRYFGIPESETIPTKTLTDALEDPKTSEKTRKRIQFALNMRKAA